VRLPRQESLSGLLASVSSTSAQTSRKPRAEGSFIHASRSVEPLPGSRANETNRDYPERNMPPNTPARIIASRDWTPRMIRTARSSLSSMETAKPTRSASRIAGAVSPA